MAIFKSCSRCGKIHERNYKCNKGLGIYDKNRPEVDNLRQSYAWEMKSKQIREASQYLCAVCREKGIYTYNNLEVHHIARLRDNPDRLLDNYNLICLCMRCHKLADSGEIDSEYLYNLAKKREDDLT